MKRKVRSKHNDLLNYFIHDARDLSPAYLASCRKFFKQLKVTSYKMPGPRPISNSNKGLIHRRKRQAPSCKPDGWPAPRFKHN